MTDRKDRSNFEDQKRRSFLQVLFKVARLANEKALKRARAASGEDWLQPAHTRLFPHIDFEGIRLTDLADRLGVTKQAVQTRVDDLAEAGMVERVPDPKDGRAKLIRWSEDGMQGLRDGLDLLRALEEEFAEIVGEQQIHQAHETLLKLMDVLEEVSEG